MTRIRALKRLLSPTKKTAIRGPITSESKVLRRGGQVLGKRGSSWVINQSALSRKIDLIKEDDVQKSACRAMCEYAIKNPTASVADIFTRGVTEFRGQEIIVKKRPTRFGYTRAATLWGELKRLKIVSE